MIQYKNKLKKHKRVCNDDDYYHAKIPNKDNKILKHNQRERSLKALFMVYDDLESLLEKIHLCQNNPEKSYTETKTKYTPSGYSLFTNCSFDDEKNVWKG